MGGDITKTGAVGGGASRLRPHWWAVLGVSLSLLALVAAAASDHPRHDGHARDAGSALPGREKGSPSKSPSPPTSTPFVGGSSPSTTSTTLPGGSTIGPATVSATGSSGSAPTAERSPVKAASVTPVPSATSTTTTTTVTPASAATPVQASTPSQAWTGELQEPDASSALEWFTGVGPTQVLVTSSSSFPLSLTVTCPEGTQTSVQPSTIEVVIPDATGACEITVKETLVQYDAIPYTLTVGPANGG